MTGHMFSEIERDGTIGNGIKDFMAWSGRVPPCPPPPPPLPPMMCEFPKIVLVCFCIAADTQE